MECNSAVRYFAAIACAGSLAPALPVLGQGAEEFEGVDPQNPVTGTVLSAGFGYRDKADIDGGGEFSEVSFSFRGGPSFQIREDVRLFASGSYRFSHYDFSDAGDLIENVHTFRVTPLFTYQLNEWTIYGGPTMGFSAEEGADFGSSFTGGGLAGAHYKYSDTLSFGGGLGVFSQIEDSVRVVPILTANWQFADQWHARLGFTEVAANGGLGAEVSYELNPEWKFSAGFQFQQKRFRLQEDGLVPDGVGQDKSVPIYAKAGWKMSEKAMFELLLGVNAGGEVLIEDNDGNEVFEEDYDPSLIIGLRAVFVF